MINYILGTIEIIVSEQRALNVLSACDIQCSKVKKNNDVLSFRIPLFKYPKALSVLKAENISYEKGELYGLPKFIYRYKKRWGIMAGGIIFASLMLISQKYIWSFEIEGNSNVEDKVIIETLGKLGCRIGSKIDDMDFDVLHNKFLIECSDIAWISVNMDGTKAKVEVRENKRGSADSGELYNIVASESGQIELLTVISGKEQIVIGDVVKKGDLLISGVETYREGEKTYYESADGHIIAKVNRVFNIEVPDKTEKKYFTGNCKTRKTVDFFGFRINLFRNSGIPYDKYDIITENRQIVLFDCVELPVWVTTEQICEYRSEAVTLSENELRSIAVKEYRSKLAEMASDAEIISINTGHSFENGVYRIECNLYCVTDIAEKVPYTIVDEGQEDK